MSLRCATALRHEAWRTSAEPCLQRDRIVTVPTAPSPLEAPKISVITCIAITLVAFALRFYKLGHPDQVVYVSHTELGPTFQRN